MAADEDTEWPNISETFLSSSSITVPNLMLSPKMHNWLRIGSYAPHYADYPLKYADESIVQIDN